jgi:hypothetical protein
MIINLLVAIYNCPIFELSWNAVSKRNVFATADLDEPVAQ